MQARDSAAPDAITRDFGRLLRHWRLVRRYSQLDLAGEASVSSRHLCFLENGRAQPSRDMVQVLGVALDLPLEAQNALHLAAGFVPPFGDRGWAAIDLEHVRHALDFILNKQEPFPAIVIDGRWDVRIRNEASRRIFGLFRKSYQMDKGLADNVMHAVFHPKGLRPFIVNWTDFAGHMVQILHREVAQGSRIAAKLRDEILVYPGVPASWKVPQNPPSSSPVMTMQLRKGDLDLDFFSMFTTFAMPHEVALQQLKIECFYPADSVTAAKTRQLAASDA
jgi:transcriptional regulator with XRE-family HTH domain